MKIKTSELTGAALDWAVAVCETRHHVRVLGSVSFIKNIDALIKFTASTDWQQGGPIIERELIETTRGGAYAEHFWKATRNSITAYGPTPLIAAMRCYVASKLGGEVDVPDALVGVAE